MGFGLLPNGELAVRLRHLVVEVDCWFGQEEAVRPHCREQVHQKVVHAAVPCVHEPHHVFKHIVHGLDNAPLAQHYLVI